MPEFSQKLIAETIACFKEEDGLSLSQDEAIAALEALGGLYIAFRECEGAASAGASAPRERAHGLISPHY